MAMHLSTTAVDGAIAASAMKGDSIYVFQSERRTHKEAGIKRIGRVLITLQQTIIIIWCSTFEFYPVTMPPGLQNLLSWS